MSVPYVNLLLVVSSTVLYVRDIAKKQDPGCSCCFSSTLQVSLLSPEQHNTASRMVEQRADAAQSQKNKKSKVSVLDVCLQVQLNKE